ncbi:MAG: hypothetical protein A2231_13260 [Candidatus Firestonebacteria bacterium RIFOXYA2_FULL_40_8]|nr:MAG: hypothetical protein A2231_13260 [Candidatus Firestonebacteria bacterium RIFOXYA2_FULL_40_8]
MRKLFGYFIFLITLVLYMVTTCPTVYVGDGGELISAAYLLGIPHAPGYPLFCLLGKLFSFMPVGSIAFRVNLVAALFASLTILLLFHLLRRIISGSGIFAFLFAAIFAVSQAFWSQATTAKGALYILNIFFLVLISYQLILWYFSRKDKYLYFASLFYGFCLANHHTALGFLPGFLLLIGFTDIKTFKRIKLLAGCFALFFLGLSLYLYLPLRALEYPLINSNNPADIKGMLDHIMRKQYGALTKSVFSFSVLFSQLQNIFIMLNKQFTVILMLLAAAGCYYMAKIIKPLFFMILAIFLTVAGGIVIVLNSELTAAAKEVNNLFFMPLYVCALLWIVFGIFLLKDKMKGRIVSFFALFMAFFFAFFLLRTNYSINDKSSNYLAYTYGADTLNSCEKNAVIFCNEDTPLYELAYLQFVEKVRPDVIVCDENGTAYRTLLTKKDKGVVYKNYMALKAEAYLQAAIKSGRPVYHTIESGVFANKSYKQITEGILYRISTDNTLPRQKHLTTKFTYPSDWQKHDIFNRDMIARYHIFTADYYFSEGKKEQAMFELKTAENIAYDMDWVQHEIGTIYARFNYQEESLRQMEKAAVLQQTSFERHNNLGNAYMALSRLEDAVKEFKKAIKNSPEIAALHHNLGNALNGLKRREEAKESYIEAAKLGQVESLHALFNMYIEDKDFEKALPVLDKLFKQYPGSCDIYVNFGIAFQKQGKIPEAERVFKNVLEIAPGNPYARVNLGNIYINKNMINEAAKEYELAIKYNPGITEAYYNLGVAYFKLNKLPEAKTCWLKTLELNPGHVGAREGMKYLK